MEFVHAEGNRAPAGAQVRWLVGEGGVKLRVLTAATTRTPARGAVMVCPGLIEFIEKYFEVACELQDRGFNIAIIDWRSQGLSERPLPNAQKVHLRISDDAPKDLATVLAALEECLPRPRLVLGHSMGAAVALRALQLGLIGIDAAVFSAPMWGVKAILAARGAALFLFMLGLGESFVPGAVHTWKAQDWRKSKVTQDQRRHERTNALLEREPRLATAGPTIGWVADALGAIAGFARPRALDGIKIPILVTTAGRDELVDNRATERVVVALSEARSVTIEGAKHEILQERDEFRAKFWATFDEFAARVAPPRD